MVGTWAILLLDSVPVSEMLGHAHVGLVAFAVAWIGRGGRVMNA
jgi:hypothetical protein